MLKPMKEYGMTLENQDHNCDCCSSNCNCSSCDCGDLNKCVNCDCCEPDCITAMENCPCD